MSGFKPPGPCPVCGEFVPRSMAACPECGACAKSGWKENSEVYDGLNLPDDDEFDYEEFTRREFGGAPAQWRPRGFWPWVGLLLVIALLWLLVRSGGF